MGVPGLGWSVPKMSPWHPCFLWLGNGLLVVISFYCWFIFGCIWLVGVRHVVHSAGLERQWTFLGLRVVGVVLGGPDRVPRVAGALVRLTLFS